MFVHESVLLQYEPFQDFETRPWGQLEWAFVIYNVMHLGMMFSIKDVLYKVGGNTIVTYYLDWDNGWIELDQDAGLGLCGVVIYNLLNCF